MWDTRNILAVRIAERSSEAGADPYGFDMGERTVVGLLATGEEVDLFSYDEEELSFDPKEFIGLTVSVARRLRHERELANLQS